MEIFWRHLYGGGGAAEMIVVVDEGKWVMRVVVMVVPKIYIAIEIL